VRSRALELLRQALADDRADFRDGQWEAISALVEHRARLLVVQRTGWGKSLVYFLGTRLLRDRGAGCTLLISPLLSLMRNQIEAARNIGVRAATINSSNPDDWKDIESRLLRNEVDVLLISPERLANDDFVARCLIPIAESIGLFVVDEAHCISDWGHDFRPDYRRIVRVLRALPRNVPALATTATANDRVVQDIVAQLGPNLAVQRGPLTRASLSLQNTYLPKAEDRLAWLAHVIPQIAGSGIVYTLTVRDAEMVAEWLGSQGIDAEPYHGAMDTQEREALENALLQNDVKALVATVALGMGFDKPDLGFVIHYQRPQSVVHYYQQVGRAGRAVSHAAGVLLNGAEDDAIANYFIRTAFPDPAGIDAVLDVLKQSNVALTPPQLQMRANVSAGSITRILKFLSLESPSPIQKTTGGYVLNPVRWRMPLDRMQRVTSLRRHEQDRMREYMMTDSCLMQFLAEELNDPAAAPCGKCANCRGQFLSEDFPRELSGRATAFVQGVVHPILPRKMWPAGLPNPQMKGKIKPEHLPLEGRALCRWGDPGLGAKVRAAKQSGEPFGDDLVTAAAQLVQNQWKPEPPPEWVTCVPSNRHPELAPDFAKALAARLKLPFVDCIRKVRETLPQKSRANSFQQVQNLLGAFSVLPSALRPGPVLLVDDMVDSRWTFTMLARLLRGAGSGPVLPFALADTSADDAD
jgi:ATP-dependent DNA helicase RecQ